MRADQTPLNSAKPNSSAQNSLFLNRFTRKETADVLATSLDQIPPAGFRHYNSMGNASLPLAMDQTQKKVSRPSNLNSLISDFESLRQNIRSMTNSDQRIVDRIQKSYDEQKFVQGVNSIRTSSGHYPADSDIVHSTGPMNYRYEVQEVHQLEGIDEAYEIRRLEQMARDMKRRLQEETNQANYYKFQVWMLQDILHKNGIRVSETANRMSRGSSSSTFNQSTQQFGLSVEQVKASLQSSMEDFMDSMVAPRMDQIDFYCNQLHNRIEGLANTTRVELSLKCGYLKNKEKYAGDAGSKTKIELLEKELERKCSELKLMEQSYSSKDSELQKFRQQVTQMVDKVRSDYQLKVSNLDGQLQLRDTQIRELQQKLRQKTADSPRKKDELSKLQREVERLTQLMEELNIELDMKDERLAEQQLRMIELEADLELNDKARKTLNSELEAIKEQCQQTIQARKQEQLKLQWPPFHSSMIENLERSHILPCTAEKEMQTDHQSSSLETSTELLNRKLQLSEETNSKLQEELLRLKGDSTDRKMYKSVLNANVESKLSEVSKLESRIPRSRRSLLRDEQPPNRKSTGNSENGGAPPISHINTWSKLSGYKEVSLNFSVDEENFHVGADLEQMIAHPDYPFERLRLGGEEAIFLLMKMSQMIRCQRDELREKKRQINFLKSRNDPARQVFASKIGDIQDEEELHLSDYSDSYSDRNGFNKRVQKRGQWQLLERESLQAIERLLDQVEGLQAELQKSQRNENNLIQMKELYKAEIIKLNRMNEQYEGHYKEEVRRMSEVLQSYEQNRSMESVKEVVCELIRLNGKDCRIGNGSSNELTEQRQVQDYLRVLAELLHIEQPAMSESEFRNDY